MSEPLARHSSCLNGCPLSDLFSGEKAKKNKCCKSFKHGKRCKKCPGKK
ncbi:MAG: hypothetical protein ACK500_05865 [Flavobacteriales bacterium]|jgi:hypothetical protein